MYYTYAHFRKSETNGKPFYIGKGSKNRAWSTVSRTKHWHRTVAKHGLRVEICAEFEIEADAYQAECDLISEWIANGAKLTNLTAGGEGLSSPSPEVRARLSKAASDVWRDPARREVLLAARNREDAVRAKREGFMRALALPGAKERRSTACKAAKNTPESIAKREKLSADPAYRAKLSAGVKAAHLRPEVVARKSAASSRRWDDPAYRENFVRKMNEKTEKRWEEQGIPEIERAARRRKSANRLRLAAGGAPMTKKEASALGRAARRANSEKL